MNDIESYVNRKGTKPGTVPSLLLVNDPILATLLNKLYEAEFEMDKVKTSVGEKSETVVLAEDKVGRIKKDIRENIVNIRGNFVNEKLPSITA